MSKTKSGSDASSKKSRENSKAGMTPHGKSILKGLKEFNEFLEGKRSLQAYRYDIPDPVNVREIREKTGLSQPQFAARFAISPRTLQEWEQGRTVPDSAVRAYLTVISRNPRAVEKALSGK
jgi:putative transcriptional regulator